jgi:hypothetical protein
VTSAYAKGRGPATIVQYLRLPSELQPGRYDELGRPDPAGRLFIGLGSGIVHTWGAFPEPLEPGQMGETIFTNTPGSYALTGNFTEWLPGPPGYSPHAVLRKPIPAPKGRYTPPEPFGPDATPQDIEEGTWDLDVTVMEPAPGAPPMTVKGVEVNVIMPSWTNDKWVISDYRALFMGRPFEQRGILGYDTNKEKYVASWVKSVQANLGQFEGTYDKKKSTLTVEGVVQSCIGERGPDGKFISVKERRVTTYKDRNTKESTVEQNEPDANGRPKGYKLRDRIVGHRRPPFAGGNVPQTGGGTMTLIALQRGVHEVKVVGRNDGRARANAAAGMVCLGPAWNAVFGDAMRL